MLRVFRTSGTRKYFIGITNLWERQPLFFAWLVGLLVATLLITANPTAVPSNQDLPLYQQASDAMRTGNLFLERFGAIAPGWPAYLTIPRAIVGSWDAAMLFSHLFLFSLLIVLTFFLTTDLFGKQVARMSTPFVAVWPSLIFQMQNGSSVLFYAVITTAILLFFFRWVHRGDFWYAVYTGLFLGFAIVTDVVALFLPLVLAGVGVFLISRRGGFQVTSVFLAGAALVTAACLLPSVWMYRNILEFEGGHVPLLVKGEQRYFDGDTVRSAISAAFEPKQNVFLSSAYRLFLFPAGLHYLNGGLTDSYKELGRRVLSGEVPFRDISTRSVVIFALKITITVLHWLVLLSVLQAIFFSRTRETALVAWAIIMYVFLAIAVTVALADNGFDAISIPSSFLVSVTPLLVTVAFVRLFSTQEDAH